MMYLKDIIRNMAIADVPTDIAMTNISSVCVDSRKVEKGSLFVALAGAKTHGAKFISDAVSAGAKIIVCEKGLNIENISRDVYVLIVENSYDFLSSALKIFYSNPSADVRLIGITGTNGKTTITYLLESLFSNVRKNCGVVGTINHRYGGRILKAGNTTPGLVDNYDLLARMVSAKVDYCAMEVSSHALDQRRVQGLDFHYAIFTNLTSDHLDYHKDHESYFLAKAKLFTSLAQEKHAIINIDDEYGLRLQEMTCAKVLTYGIKNSADFCAQRIELGFAGTRFDLATPCGVIKIQTPLIGLHNIYNILSVAAVGIGEGMILEEIKKGIEALSQVPGRLERIEAGQNFHVFVDYAHTEDALRNVLSSIRAVKKARVIVVFGCGGDRDKTKRPRMANAVEELSDFAIVTTDNPRTEDPKQIIDEICAGFKKKDYLVIVDREQAIIESLHYAKGGDVVLIAGKGHEDYQIFKNKTINFDERQIVMKNLLNLKHT
ncbi:MAG: UDP-N-acetylmuramoyl-L-alanyl-D-glutamate--2,6-diaminopimelate ligase [Candidatus Omnitrophica bacterium]|nr:UDP-N-acetylmuramoyl-L-alanyl-D-glutamate--2,6-diaminopimelate ligase [Candidatus Omnitrophota bacterium]